MNVQFDNYFSFIFEINFFIQYFTFLLFKLKNLYIIQKIKKNHKTFINFKLNIMIVKVSIIFSKYKKLSINYLIFKIIN